MSAETNSADRTAQLMRSYAERNSFGRPDEVVRHENAIGCRWDDKWNAVIPTNPDDLPAVEQKLREWADVT